LRKDGKSSRCATNASEPGRDKVCPRDVSADLPTEPRRAQSSSEPRTSSARRVTATGVRPTSGCRSVGRPVAAALLPEQILRILSAVVRCTGSAPHALLVGREQAIAGIAPSASLQAEPILYSGWRRDGRRMSARERRRAWNRDRSEGENGQPRGKNPAHDITSMRFGCMVHPHSRYMCSGAGIHQPLRLHVDQIRSTATRIRSRSVILRSELLAATRADAKEERPPAAGIDQRSSARWRRR